MRSYGRNRLHREVLHGIGSSRKEGPCRSHTAQARGLAPLPSSPSLQSSPAPTPTLAAGVEAEFHKLQQLWPIPRLPTSFLPQKTAAAGRGRERKGCNNNPKNLFISAAPIFTSKLNSRQLSLSLAHNQMIAQDSAEKGCEAAEPASPPPVWEGASHYTEKEMHLFPEAVWGRKSS